MKLGDGLMIKVELGNRIKELRINMDRSYFSSVESWKRNISIVNIKKIADGLDVTLSELFKGM